MRFTKCRRRAASAIIYLLEFGDRSLRHPGGYAGDAVDFHFERLESGILIQGRFAEDVLEVLQRYGEDEVAPGYLEHAVLFFEVIFKRLRLEKILSQNFICHSNGNCFNLNGRYINFVRLLRHC